MSEADLALGQPAFEFGTFQLFPRSGVLKDNGRDVRLGSRAVELLTALVERAGEVAPSEELIARVWPTTTVAEQNLRAQIAGLRKALADGHRDDRFISTVPGRGYRFSAPVLMRTGVQEPPTLPRESKGNLPAGLTRLFGRSKVLGDLRRRLANERLVSIVGPGGVGKTSLAVAAAHEVEVESAWFADLGPVSDPGMVPTTILETFGLAATPDNMLAAVAHRVERQSVLLVLDNCEHLMETCAPIAEGLLGAARGLRILATSREPLRAADECVVRLPTLDTPEGEISLEKASACSSVQLFAQRAASSESRFSLEPTTLAPVVEICRRLDGLPLALELAATAVSTLGVHGVAERLREQLDIPTRGRRTAAARQKTMRAALDWSYRLLPPAEQQALRRLAVFQGAFTLESATAIARGSSDASTLELIAGLAEKSLLSVDLSREAARYRLLQTTRAFALAQITPPEAAAIRSSHAREVRRLVEVTDAARGAGDGDQARHDAADLIDDLVAAIEWALSPVGDLDTAVELIIASAPVRRRLSLVRDHRKHVERALDQVRALSSPHPAAEMRLLGSYGLASAYRYATRDWIIAGAERLQVLAEALGDGEHIMLGLWARSIAALNLGDTATQKRCAERMVSVWKPGCNDAFRALAHHMSGVAAVHDGDIAAARREAEAGLALMAAAPEELHTAHLGFEPSLELYDILAPILWAQGFPDQALAAARASIARCRRLSHTQSLIFALGDAGATAALLIGDVEAATAFLDEHRRLCEERGERGYLIRAQEFLQALLRIERTGVADAAAASLVAPGSRSPVLAKPQLSARIAEAVGRSRSPKEGLAALETVSAYAGGARGFIGPELMRVRASLLMMSGAPASEVEALLRQALERASQLGLLTFELRIVTTLAEILVQMGSASEALALLADILDRMPEGHNAADYRRAKSLKHQISIQGV